MNEKLIQKAIYDLLKAIGENPEREGLKNTPKRVARMYKEMLGSPDLKYVTFEENYNNIVVVKDIEFFSICEHHLMPFYGIIHIAYIPNKKVVGISKLGRVVEKFSKRLQIQERMTEQILNDVKENLGTEDVAVYVEAKHMCVMARGVKKSSSKTITIKMSGSFKKENKEDFYFLINEGRYNDK